jgi:hypothetical protein
MPIIPLPHVIFLLKIKKTKKKERRPPPSPRRVSVIFFSFSKKNKDFFFFEKARGGLRATPDVATCTLGSIWGGSRATPEVGLELATFGVARAQPRPMGWPASHSRKGQRYL